MDIPQTDITILRELAHQVAYLASQPDNLAKRTRWTNLTDLRATDRPATLIHLWPLAWSEALPDAQHLRCQHETARLYERDMRQRIWSVTTLRDDTVIEPIIRYPHCVEITPYKDLIVEKQYAAGDHARTGAARFIPVIRQRADIERIGDPIVSVDDNARQRYQEEAEAIFGAILDVIPSGVYFAAKVVDEWVELRGMQNLFVDMIDDPRWTHEALQRITDNFRKRFMLCEELGVWGPWDKSDPLGSTGLRFNPEIPNYQEIMQKGRATLLDSWAFTCAEGFTCVSPAMHQDFGLAYDLQLMPLFKHVNIGCCEVLSHKINYVRQIPNARRVSISEWCDFEKAGVEIGTDYLYGYKPSGVPFVGRYLDEQAVREEIRQVLHAARDCHTEIILNIGGTLGEGDGAQKLVKWSEIAAQEIADFYG